MIKKKKDSQFETPEDLEDFMSETPIEEDAEEFDEEAGKDAEDTIPVEEDIEDEDVSVPELEDEEEEEDMLDIAADVPIQVVAVLGKRNISIKEIAALKLGEVIELNRPANEIVDLVAGGKLIAKGELVEIEGKLGVRIVKMLR
jgi:type III secretion system YscQ/HrcQ family protein